MSLTDDLVVLPLAFERGGQTNLFHASLILDATHGPTLVDTGLPGQVEAIESLLAAQNLGVTALRSIILAHQDIGHIGSLHELVMRSGTRVLAHRIEVPFIDGRELPRFARPRYQRARRGRSGARRLAGHRETGTHRRAGRRHQRRLPAALWGAKTAQRRHRLSPGQ